MNCWVKEQTFLGWGSLVLTLLFAFTVLYRTHRGFLFSTKLLTLHILRRIHSRIPILSQQPRSSLPHPHPPQPIFIPSRNNLLSGLFPIIASAIFNASFHISPLLRNLISNAHSLASAALKGLPRKRQPFAFSTVLVNYVSASASDTTPIFTSGNSQLCPLIHGHNTRINDHLISIPKTTAIHSTNYRLLASLPTQRPESPWKYRPLLLFSSSPSYLFEWLLFAELHSFRSDSAQNACPFSVRIAH